MPDYSILVVDDEKIIRATLEFDLKNKGYIVTLAKNGADAILKLNENNYDLIITDLLMPGKDGIEVLKKAKACNANALVIILTGHGSIESAINALRIGATDYLLKPYNKTELFVRIDKCIEKFELLKKIKIYENFLPVCCKCKMVRNDTGKEHGKGKWMDMDRYLSEIAKIDITHGLCPICLKEMEMEIDRSRM